MLVAMALSSANYTINEWLDAPFDAMHPTKRSRPAVQTHMSPALVFTQYILLTSGGMLAANTLGGSFSMLDIVFAIFGVIYNVRPIRAKDPAFLDVIVESVNNPLRFLFGWFAVTPLVAPPVSILLAYWFGGAFLMAAKRVSEHRAMALRKAARVAKGLIWTKEQEKRDSWPRAWKWLGPLFGDCDPRTIEPEHFLRIDPMTGEAKGLVAEIERTVSVTERHMVIKVWRALWKKMAAMKYCSLDQDPGKSFANTPPLPRDAIWSRRETLKLVQVAWRHKYYGLAALMAVAWDSQLSPIDNRSLTSGQARSDNVGIYFALPRAKTGRAAAATLTTWSQAILIAYLKQLGAELLDTTPLFWTRGGKPISRKGETGQWGGDHGGGRHVVARPYSKSALNKDFRTVRELAFGKDEIRQLQDMRRSGGVEGDAGGGSIEDQSNKMANTIDRNKQLRKTYNPVNVASVRRFDEARVVGARKLEQRASESVTTPPLVTLLKTGIAAKPLNQWRERRDSNPRPPP
jgi:hypothetical protein